MNFCFTKEELIKEGQRYSTEEILKLIDTLHPLASADNEALADHGYSQKLQDELDTLHGKLQDASASRQKLNGEKQGACAGAIESLKEGGIILRQGIALANVAIAMREIPANEDEQAAREKTAQLKKQVKVLSGNVGKDAAKLCTRLSALKAILTSPEFAPPSGDEQTRGAFITKLDEVIARINNLAETKQALKENARDKTVSTDEMHGRALVNLKLLVQVGNACFRASGDKAHAKLYNMKGLRHKKATKSEIPASSTSDNAPIPVTASSSRND